MRILILLLSVTLGLTTTAQAKKLWECRADIFGDGALFRFTNTNEDKLVHMSDVGDITEFLCNLEPLDTTEDNPEVCIDAHEENKNGSLFHYVIFLDA